MYRTLVVIYRWFVSFAVMLLAGTFCLILVLISFGYLRNFCNIYIFAYTSRFMLRISGYTIKFPPKDKFPKYQVLYTINHNSFLDIFILTAFGLPDLRFILSESTFKYIPLVISAKAFGTHYIPQKKHAERRLKFFIRTTEFLKRTNYSIIASAEGVHPHTHTIHPFNKGIFHMAMEAKIPIVPLFIFIPEEINPFEGSYSKTGEIEVIMMDEIDTSDWKLETIWDEIAKVRKVYVDKFNELNRTNIT
jgi:1-acyl-sn-glycerol-3-phosphate acyltransferase